MIDRLDLAFLSMSTPILQYAQFSNSIGHNFYLDRLVSPKSVAISCPGRWPDRPLTSPSATRAAACGALVRGTMPQPLSTAARITQVISATTRSPRHSAHVAPIYALYEAHTRVCA